MRKYLATIKLKLRLADNEDPFEVLKKDLKAYIESQEIVSVKELKE